jgi:hypothetical protein
MVYKGRYGICPYNQNDKICVGIDLCVNPFYDGFKIMGIRATTRDCPYNKIHVGVGFMPTH